MSPFYPDRPHSDDKLTTLLTWLCEAMEDAERLDLPVVEFNVPGRYADLLADLKHTGLLYRSRNGWGFDECAAMRLLVLEDAA